MARFDNHRCTVEHQSLRKNVADLSGWRCKVCGEIAFDPDSAKRYAAAGDALVLAFRA
jgi:HTH-type transcriptional regulator/antitoxin MqsA